MNYQLITDEILEEVQKLDKKPKLLLHACCAPCSSYVLEYLNDYFDITVFYFNPNIYPIEEYTRRLKELEKFIHDAKYIKNVKLIQSDYNPDDYYKAVKGLEELGERSNRCYKCYEFRMNKAALYGKENNFDYFTTTLSISPYKNAEWINEIGKNLENKFNIKYLYSDFKKRNGYKRSLELSKEYKLYRQDYCGCVFSKETSVRKLEI